MAKTPTNDDDRVWRGAVRVQLQKKKDFFWSINSSADGQHGFKSTTHLETHKQLQQQRRKKKLEILFCWSDS